MSARPPCRRPPGEDPSAAYSLETVLRAWWRRDPVEAALDAAALARVLEERATALREAGRAP